MTAPVVPTTLVVGIPIAATDYLGAVEQAKVWARSSDRTYSIAAAATHCVTLGRHDPAFGEALATFDLVLPDGMPLVWVMNRSLASPLRDRIYGPNFMLRCLEATLGEPWSHVLLGGSDELLGALKMQLLERYPALRVAAMIAPPFGAWSEEEDQRIITIIRESGAQFVWIGLGCPKQESWLARNKHRLPAGVYSTVGAAFAFHAGRVRQAPPWMQRFGLEWVFRLFSEPRRLWRRYLVFNSLFVYYVVRDAFVRRK